MAQHALRVVGHVQQQLQSSSSTGCFCSNSVLSTTQDSNASQAARLDDAAALLQDKDRLEETVKKQHALIEQRGQELKVMKAQLDGKEAGLEKAR